MNYEDTAYWIDDFFGFLVIFCFILILVYVLAYFLPSDVSLATNGAAVYGNLTGWIHD